MKMLTFSYKDYDFPINWNEYRLKDLLSFIERPINMDDNAIYDLVTVKRNFVGVVSRGKFKGKKILVKNQFEIKKNDFLISKRQIAHGACGIVPEQLEGSIVSNEYNVLKPTDDILVSFLKYYVQLPFMRRYFYIMSDGVHIEKLLFKPRSWMKLKVTIPPINEQKKITQILTTLDKTIELKEKLIQEKNQRKIGLMQNLLTGQVKIPGFTGKWQEVKLGNILKERKETGFNDLELLAITSKHGVVRRCEIDIKDNSSDDKSKYKRICPLDIGYNTMRMWQGVSGVSKHEGIVSPAYTILKPTKNIDSHFVGYLFKLPKVINLFKRYSQGLVNDTLNLKYPNLKVIKVNIPIDIDEQKSIANILVKADKELTFLNKELDALKQQKKGLMQLLLTGKVRVKS